MSSKYFYNLAVKSIKKETIDCVTVSFLLPEALRKEFTYHAGQYLTIQHEINGEILRRSYSICTSPDENELTIAVKKIDGGKFSTFMNESLQAGSILEVMKPSGNFIYEPDSDKQINLVFFAAGSGITPIIAHIKNLLHNFPLVQITLFYGNKNVDSIIFKEELESLKNKYISRFAIYHILTRQKVGVPVLFGRMDNNKCEALINKLFYPEKTDAYFLCGPAEMIFSIKDTLINNGSHSSSIHYELFNNLGILKENTDSIFNGMEDFSDTISKVSIKMDGDIFDYTLSYNGKTLLDAALANGADLPFACKGGVCSTCKAKLIEGKVEMDLNYALEPDELANGYILMCQAHPRSQKLQIDFDQK